MNSFSSELGLQFGSTLEAPHVIDVESQVCYKSFLCAFTDYLFLIVAQLLQLQGITFATAGLAYYYFYWPG